MQLLDLALEFFDALRSAVVTPSRTPVSISCRRTQPSNVYGTQPIIGAIDSTGAHSEEYSPGCSCTMRTARSRISGENLFDLFMAPYSQEGEPPQNPERFTMRGIDHLAPTRFSRHLRHRHAAESGQDQYLRGARLPTGRSVPPRQRQE